MFKYYVSVSISLHLSTGDEQWIVAFDLCIVMFSYLLSDVSFYSSFSTVEITKVSGRVFTFVIPCLNFLSF